MPCQSICQLLQISFVKCTNQPVSKFTSTLLTLANRKQEIGAIEMFCLKQHTKTQNNSQCCGTRVMLKRQQTDNRKEIIEKCDTGKSEIVSHIQQFT